MTNVNYTIDFSFCTNALHKCDDENVNLKTEIHYHFTYCVVILHIALSFCILHFVIQIEYC